MNHLQSYAQRTSFGHLATSIALSLTFCSLIACSEPVKTSQTDISKAVVVDFDIAMHGVNFDLAGDNNGDFKGNGISDATEMALISAILAKPELDLSATGGVQFAKVSAAYQATVVQADDDLSLLAAVWPTAPTVIAGYSMLGKTSFAKIKTMTAGFGADLTGNYHLALALEPWLSAQGDADGDGVSNVAEYAAAQTKLAPQARSVAEVRALYLSTVLDPLQKEEGEVQLPLEKQTQKLRVGILLYPGFEMLDVYGPLQMWAYIPDFEVSLIAENPGPVNSAQQFATVANYGFADAPALDILMVPGGMGTFAQLNNPKLLEFIQKADKTTQLTSSVCTGSAILAKAGVLSGQKATTNKRFFFLSEQQTNDVQWIESARWVQSGKYFTSSGVTAGTDMALGLIAHLYGHDKAAELASSLEYQWQSDSSKDPFAQFIQRQQVQASGPVALSKVEPAAEQVITGESPRFIQIYFNKAPEVAKSDISMLDAKGRSIQLRGLHTMGSNDLMILIQEPLTSGRYQVKWQASFGGLDQSKQASEQLSGDYWFEYRH